MKNFYKILGVLDDAEDIVIRAAYKALAQRYHPDKWRGDPNIANQRMSEINEAYSILSDAQKRKQYDQEFFSFNSRDDAETSSNAEHDDVINEEVEDWELVVEFFPIIQFQYDELKRISAILANTFRTVLIETRDFNNSGEIKKKYENDYMERYYGKDLNVRNFAKRLLTQGHHKAAIKLNKIVRLMGESVELRRIRLKIFKDFPETNPSECASIKSAMTAILDGKYNSNQLKEIIEYTYHIKVDERPGDNYTTFTLNVEGLDYEKIGISSLYIIARKAVDILSFY